jgi:hypothetical protein
MKSYLIASGIVFILAVALAAYIWVGERRYGHARDDD